VAAEEAELRAVGRKDLLLCRRGRRLLAKMEVILKNASAFSNVLVKLCKIFTCVNFK
jgi:hypothetical protein